VLANGPRLARVIGHLIQNAIEATPRAGVQVHLQKDDNCAVLEVRDTGHGMDAQFIRERLFRPSSRPRLPAWGSVSLKAASICARSAGRCKSTATGLRHHVPHHATVA
jgi:phosphoglycerate-specific signal transduction histidine kinase